MERGCSIFFLIAGHMRLETARAIARMSPKQLPQKPDEYRGSYYAELRFGLTAEQAIRIQINENVRISLHPVDEMFAAQMVWKWKKVSGKSLRWLIWLGCLVAPRPGLKQVCYSQNCQKALSGW
jgi:hypothetical protein